LHSRAGLWHRHRSGCRAQHSASGPG
jgi:hypothetical protein